MNGWSRLPPPWAKVLLADAAPGMTRVHRAVTGPRASGRCRRMDAGVHGVEAGRIPGDPPMTSEAPCPVCHAIIRLNHAGLLAWHRVDGAPCRGSGKRPYREDTDAND